MSVYTAVLAVALAAALVVVISADYARRSRVVGFLVPDQGLIKLHTPKAGRVVRRLVDENAHVHRDDLLVVVDVSAMTAKGRTGDRIAESLSGRRTMLAADLARLDRTQASDRATLTAQIASLEAQVEALGREHDARKAMSQLAEAAAARGRALLAQRVASVSQVEKTDREFVQAQIDLATLGRAREAARGELDVKRAELAGLGDRQEAERSSLHRAVAEIDQQIAQSEEQSLIELRAPQDGVVTRIVANAGGAAEPATPLLILVPDGATLQAALYAGPAAAGFLHPGTRVLLRYDAYPHVKFGLQEAEVVSVSRTAVSPRELPFPISSDDPVYVVSAKLAKSTITALGREEPLQPGARLQADLLLERRRLWEWAIEPLLATGAAL